MTKLDTELAAWCPLLDAPADRAVEATFYGDRLAESDDDRAPHSHARSVPEGTLGAHYQ